MPDKEGQLNHAWHKDVEMSCVPFPILPFPILASLVKQIDVELAETVSQEPSQWKLASLRLDAEALVEQSETTLHRGTARLLLEKIKEFEKLQLRYAGIDGLEPVGPPSDSGGESRPADAESLSDFDPRFDGPGWLLPVHSSRQASPPYALLDQQGQILKFISPAPGLNLHRYLRKEVGIFGQRSRAEFLNKPPSHGRPNRRHRPTPSLTPFSLLVFRKAETTLSYVAGMGRSNRAEFVSHGYGVPVSCLPSPAFQASREFG